MNTNHIGKITAEIGISTTLAMIIGYIEMLIPFSMGIPGVKLGLANIVIIIVLYRQGVKKAFIVSIIRIVLLGFLFGNLSMIMYSLAGGIMSLSGMYVMKKCKGISILGVSVFGGVLHNLGQIILAAIVIENLGIMGYLPILLFTGTITGLLIGIIAKEVIKRIPTLS